MRSILVSTLRYAASDNFNYLCGCLTLLPSTFHGLLVFNIIDKKATEKNEIAFKHPQLTKLELDSYIQSTDGKVYSQDTDPFFFSF